MDQPDFLSFALDFSAEHVISAYDELPLWSAMFGLLLLDEVPLSGVHDLLDVGCGTGFPLIELAERLGSETNAHGVDSWVGALGRAKEKIATRSTPNVIVHQADAVAMPFEEASFDLIVSNLGLNNFDDPAAAIAECRRVARTGSVLALTTNLQGHMQELYDSFRALLEERSDRDAIARLDEHVGHRATIPAVRALLADGGFAVRRVVERSSVMRFANATALFDHYFIKLGFLDGWKKVVPGREAEDLLELRDRLNAVAAERGALRLTIPMAYIEAVATS